MNRFSSQIQIYHLHTLELSEYTRISPQKTGIYCWMYIDESASFIRWDHPLWLIISYGFHMKIHIPIRGLEYPSRIDLKLLLAAISQRFLTAHRISLRSVFLLFQNFARFSWISPLKSWIHLSYMIYYLRLTG